MLELNTATATMREVLEKVVKRKLGVTGRVIMQGSNLESSMSQEKTSKKIWWHIMMLFLTRFKNVTACCIWFLDCFTGLLEN